MLLLPVNFQASTVSGARRRAASAWLAEETSFPETFPPVTVQKAVCFIIQFRKKGDREHLYSVNNKVVNDLRRHTMAYVKSIGGLPIIPDLPRREYKKKDRLYWKPQGRLEIWKNW